MHSRGEALSLANKANRANAGGKAKNFAKRLKFAKKFPMNAGRKAKMLKMAKTLKLAKSKTKKSKSGSEKTRKARAVNASHTRSHGEFPDPPVRLWRVHGLRTEAPRFGIHEDRFHCDAHEETLSDGTRLKFVAVSLKESTLEGAGRGLFVVQDVEVGTDICEYGGITISQEEAKRRQIEEMS
jgi:hypothetical protein